MTKTNTFLLLSYLCLASVSTAILSPALPAVMQTFHISKSTLTWVTSIFLLGYMLGQLLYAPLANYYGAIKALRSGLCLMLFGVILTIFSALNAFYPMFLIGRFISAIGAASGLSCTFMLLKQLLSEREAAKASAYGPFFFTVGIGVASYVGGVLSDSFTWISCLYALLLHGTIMLILTCRFEAPIIKSEPLNVKSIITAYKATFNNLRLIYFSFCVGMVSIVAYGYSAAAPLYAAKTLHMNAQIYGQWNLINMVGMALSSFFAAYILERYSHRVLFNIALLGLLPCIISLAIMSQQPSINLVEFFINSGFLYLFSGLMFPVGSYYALRNSADHGSAASMMSFINIGSAFLAVSIMGYLPVNILSAYCLMLIMGFIIVFIGFLCLSSANSKTLEFI